MRLPIRQIVILLSLIVAGGILLSIFFLKGSFLGTSSPGIISLLPQINSEGPITVKVSPRDLSQSATSWDFEILLDTHSQNLDQDLLKASVLIDDAGNQFIPFEWETVPASEVEAPQEHHRQEILKFKPISPRPNSIELKILNIGDINERIFRWDLE